MPDRGKQKISSKGMHLKTQASKNSPKTHKETISLNKRNSKCNQMWILPLLDIEYKKRTFIMFKEIKEGVKV